MKLQWQPWCTPTTRYQVTGSSGTWCREGGSSSTGFGVVWPSTRSGDGVNIYSISTPPPLTVKEFAAGTLGLYASEDTYSAGIPATVGTNIHTIPVYLS